jgi:hypothetical protein
VVGALDPATVLEVAQRPPDGGRRRAGALPELGAGVWALGHRVEDLHAVFRPGEELDVVERRLRGESVELVAHTSTTRSRTTLFSRNRDESRRTA